MKKNAVIWVVAAILVAIAVFTVTNYNKQAVLVPPTPPAASEPAPAEGETSSGQAADNRLNLLEAPYDFTLEDLNGNKVKLSSFKGKKIFINFWTTWCPYCVEEMPDIEKLYQETKDGDLVILTINSGESKKTAQEFIEKKGFTFPVLLDIDGKVSQLYEVAYLPTSYFIDSEGYLVKGVTQGLSLEAMKAYVDALD